MATQEHWELCRLEGVNDDRSYLVPKIRFFTSEGVKLEYLNPGKARSDPETVAKRIAKLGSEGWEMVATTGGGTWIYFKRRI